MPYKVLDKVLAGTVGCSDERARGDEFEPQRLSYLLKLAEFRRLDVSSLLPCARKTGEDTDQ